MERELLPDGTNVNTEYFRLITKMLDTLDRIGFSGTLTGHGILHTNPVCKQRQKVNNNNKKGEIFTDRTDDNDMNILIWFENAWKQMTEPLLMSAHVSRYL